MATKHIAQGEQSNVVVIEPRDGTANSGDRPRLFRLIKTTAFSIHDLAFVDAPVFHVTMDTCHDGEVYNLAIRGGDSGGLDGIDVWGKFDNNSGIREKYGELMFLIKGRISISTTLWSPIKMKYAQFLHCLGLEKS